MLDLVTTSSFFGDPTEVMKWAAGITAFLGGTAFGIKKLLTIWGKENTEASSASAANDIIVSLRSEIKRINESVRTTLKENEELLSQVTHLHREVLDLRNKNHKLVLNNEFLKEELQQSSEKLSKFDPEENEPPSPAFSTTEIDGIKIKPNSDSLD